MVFLNVNSDPFFIYRKIMRIFGIWPGDGSVIVFMVFAVIEIAAVLLRLVDPIRQCDEYEAAHAAVTAATFMYLTRRSAARLYGSQVVPLIESVVDDWSSISDPTEWRTMKQHDRFGLFLQLVVAGMLLPIVPSHAVAYLASPNLLTTPDYHSNCDGDYSWMWGVAFPVFNGVLTVLQIICGLTSTIFWWSLSMHLCGQFQILKHRFQEFLLITDKKESRREFRRLVDRHNELIHLSDILEDSFNVILAIQICYAQIFYCFVAADLGHSIKTANFANMAEALGTILAVLVRLYLAYDAGDYMTASCEAIGDVLIHCNWYELSKDSIRNFTIVIARSRMPTQLTAAKIFKLNRSNFKYVVQALYSYITLIVTITTV